MLDTTIRTQLEQQDVIGLLRGMIRHNTTNPPGNERPLAEMLAELMEKHGLESEVDVFAENRANVLGRLRGSGERKALLLNGHLDVVPVGEIAWPHEPFAGEVVDGMVYGRGSSDMKSGLAAMLAAAFAVKASGRQLKGDLLIAGSAGEETDSIGARLFLEQGRLKDVGAIVVGEPSSCGVNVAEKGALWVQVVTRGKTAHGAFPELGVNAITAMNDFLVALRAYQFTYTPNKLVGRPSMNISTIQGGVKTNVVPDKCVLTIDIRTVPGMDHGRIVEDLREICRTLKTANASFEAEVEAINDRPAIETAVDHPFVKLACDIIRDEFGRQEVPKGVNFYTDAAIFLPPTGLPAILYGPGDAAMAHQPDEHVSIERVREAAHFYASMIERYLIQ